jgi:RNA polymerase sigma factor (sigma-70 family)
MQHHRDQDLLAAYAAGDQEAFAALMARHQELVRAACRRQSAPGDWDDCAQAVFLVLSRRADSARRAPALEAWLLRTASFVCRASKRAQLRRQRAERAVPPESPAGQPSEAAEMLDECLLRLPDRQRAAVSLHYLAGKSPDDIASALGLTRNHVYQLLHRGLETLRAQFMRRGVAMSVAALTGLLASEAQAATTATTAAATITLGATPSANAIALAKGASQAMTIAYLAPFAASAALLLSAGIATTLVAVEAKPAASTPAGKPGLTIQASATTPQAPPATASAQAAAWLDKRLTLDFSAGVPLAKAVEEIGRQAGGTIVLDPHLEKSAIQAPVNIKVGQMKVSDFLHWVAMAASLRYQVVNGACLVLAEDQPVPDVAGRCSLAGLGAQHLKRLDQPVSVEISGEAPVALVQAGRQLGLEVVFDPKIMVIESPRTVAFAARSLRGRDLLAWVCYLGGLQARVVQGRLFVEPAAAYGGF